MARKTNRSFAGFLRGYRNEQPEYGFDLAELLQPVVVVDDVSHATRKLTVPTIITRLYKAAAAGVYNLGTYTAGPYGAVVVDFWCGGTARIALFDDGTDGITANRAAVDPPGNFRNLAPFRGRLSIGENAADPNPGTEITTLVANDVGTPIFLPPNCALSFYTVAVNQTLSIDYIHIREGIDA